MSQIKLGIHIFVCLMSMLVDFGTISSKLNCADRCRIVRPLIVGLFLYRFQALSGGFWNHIGVVLRLAGFHIIRLRIGWGIPLYVVQQPMEYHTPSSGAAIILGLRSGV